MNISWNTSAGAIASMAVAPRLSFNTMGKDPSPAAKDPYTNSENLAVSTALLRCDIGVALAGSVGCVFTDAAPVYVLRRGDPSVKEGAEHIYMAQRRINNPAPGAWKLREGTRIEATRYVPGLNTDALVRAKSEVYKNANRHASCGTQSSSLINSRLPLWTSSTCSASRTGCSCDEYPFASTQNGGYHNAATTSVQLINHAQNVSSGGGRLSSFYGNNRLIDYTVYPSGSHTVTDISLGGGDEFWVHIQ
jgi:hypothetical protein